MSRAIPSRWSPYVEACASGQIPDLLQIRAAELVAGAAAARVSRKAKPLPESIAFAERRRAREEAEQEAARRQMHESVWIENRRMTAGPSAPFGRCDCGCGGRFNSAAEGECDHWIERSQGGPDTRENGWRLLGKCHRAKTDNRPDRPYWNAKRSAYCTRAGIPFVNRRAR